MKLWEAEESVDIVAVYLDWVVWVAHKFPELHKIEIQWY